MELFDLEDQQNHPVYVQVDAANQGEVDDVSGIDDQRCLGDGSPLAVTFDD